MFRLYTQAAFGCNEPEDFRFLISLRIQENGKNSVNNYTIVKIITTFIVQIQVLQAHKNYFIKNQNLNSC
jgi:hypothetical protein